MSVLFDVLSSGTATDNVYFNMLPFIRSPLPPLFSQVSVLFDVLSSGTATDDVDFNVVNSEVFFEEGQKRKSLPLRILDDRLAEKQEWFVVKLTQPKGGAKIGTTAQCNVTIEASDDPNGAFGKALLVCVLFTCFIQKGRAGKYLQSFIYVFVLSLFCVCVCVCVCECV